MTDEILNGKPYVRNPHVRFAAFAVAALAVGAAFALDPVQDDFWDTTGYVNASPNVAESSANASELVSFISNMKESAPMESEFRSTKLGFILIFR